MLKRVMPRLVLGMSTRSFATVAPVADQRMSGCTKQRNRALCCD